jgi:hypothetical protein
MCFYSRTTCRAPRSCAFTRRGSAMSIISVLLLAAIFFLILYLIWLLPAPWRVRQIIQIVAVILGLVYLFQHQTLLHF